MIERLMDFNRMPMLKKITDKTAMPKELI